MGRLKGAGSQPPPPSSDALNHVEMDFDVHRAATEAKFSEIQNSFESFCNQQSQFRNEIMEELRQLRVGPKTLADQVDSNPLQFGTLPAVSSPVRAPATSDVSMTVVSTEVVGQGNSTNTEPGMRNGSRGFPLNLSHQEVILGLNSE